MRRLEKRGLLSSAMQPPEDGEGGRPRRVFRVEDEAVEVEEILRDLEELTADGRGRDATVTFWVMLCAYPLHELRERLGEWVDAGIGLLTGAIRGLRGVVARRVSARIVLRRMAKRAAGGY